MIAGDLMHANNVRFMLADRAVHARARLRDVPVRLDECELARLIPVGVAAGDPALAARCQGALTALNPPAASGRPQDTHPALQDPAYATFVSEGRIGGIGLLVSLYPAQ